MIGDKDPEDAYDAGDPIHVRLAVLARVFAALDANPGDVRTMVRRHHARRLLVNIITELDGG